MMNWYVSADMARRVSGSEAEQIGIAGASIHAGRVKTMVQAETPKEAIDKGRAVIDAALEDGLRALNYGCMPVEAVAELGDEEVYARMRTV